MSVGGFIGCTSILSLGIAPLSIGILPSPFSPKPIPPSPIPCLIPAENPEAAG